MANNPAGSFISLPGYPTSAWGATKIWRGDHIGPNPYVTGGELISATPIFGSGGIETVGSSFSGYTQSQNYTVRGFPPANGMQVAETFATAFQGNNNASAIYLKWFYAANGVEVANNTNLAAEIVRLDMYGG